MTDASPRIANSSLGRTPQWGQVIRLAIVFRILEPQHSSLNIPGQPDGRHPARADLERRAFR